MRLLRKGIEKAMCSTPGLLPTEIGNMGVLYPKHSQICIVHYMGITEDGKKFNASSNRNRHFIILDKQKVIRDCPERRAGTDECEQKQKGKVLLIS